MSQTLLASNKKFVVVGGFNSSQPNNQFIGQFWRNMVGSWSSQIGVQLNLNWLHVEKCICLNNSMNIHTLWKYEADGEKSYFPITNQNFNDKNRSPTHRPSVLSVLLRSRSRGPKATHAAWAVRNRPSGPRRLRGNLGRGSGCGSTRKNSWQKNRRPCFDIMVISWETKGMVWDCNLLYTYRCLYTQHDNNMTARFYGRMGGYPPSFGRLNAESGDQPLLIAHA